MSGTKDIAYYMSRIDKVIINPLIVLMFAVAVVVFVWGMIEFLSNRDSEEAQTKGKSHMLWGIVGIFIMLSVFGIINLLIGTFGLTGVNNAPIEIPKYDGQKTNTNTGL